MSAALARSCEIKINALDGVNGGSPSEVSEKNKRNLMIKELQSLVLPNQRARSLDMKYYLATRGLSFVYQPSNNI